YWTSWERLRVFGKLPIFGASYSAMLTLPFLFYLLEVFNGRVEQIRASASLLAQGDSAVSTIAKALLSHLHAEPVPRLSLLLFIGTILLAIASTIYAVGCPP